MPVREKISKMSVCLERSLGGKEIAEISFNMADYKYGEYKILRLYLHQSESNNGDYPIDQESTFLDIGLKGTKVKGLLQRSTVSGAKSSYGGSTGYHSTKSLMFG